MTEETAGKVAQAKALMTGLCEAWGLVKFYPEDLKLDFKRLDDMAGEEFIWVATDSSSDALPIGVHPKATSYLSDVMEIRLKQCRSTRLFFVAPSRGVVIEITEAEARSKMAVERYRLDGGKLIRVRDKAVLGTYTAKNTHQFWAGKWTSEYSWQNVSPEITEGLLDAIATYEAVHKVGPWVSVMRAEPEAA